VTERERWIVYPLLFFAVAMIFRDHPLTTSKPNNVLESRFVICEQLQVVDGDKRVVVHVGSNGSIPHPDRPRSPGSGFVDVFAPASGAAGQTPLKAVTLWVDAKDGQGVVETFNHLGMPVVEIAGDSLGGQVRLNDRLGRLRTVAAPPPATDDPRAAPPRPPVPPESQ
jgi:hypothetical protein